MSHNALHKTGGASARGQEFWRAVLRASEFTALPRWTLSPVPGIGEHEAAIPAELMTALHRLADKQEVPLSAALLTAHLKVLAALCGEAEVTTGYALPAAAPLPLPMTLGPGSWRQALRQTARTEAELLRHRDFPLDALRHELGLTEPLFETLFDPLPDEAEEDGELAAGIVLRVGLVQRQEPVLRLRYRTEVLDDACAARIAGYHLRALALLAADPDAEHATQSLLSAQELRVQLHELGGPRRKLPDCRVHELFEARARLHPDAIAATYGDSQLTYRQLNSGANQLARELLARGLGREGVVAVVTERNLDWLTAVLAIFKAGGAYLPIEPHFPAERIARTLARAECRLVLSERGSTEMLDQALDSLGEVQRLLIDAAYEEGLADGESASDLGLEVAPDQLAYIYFTSGSTGEPKGAMCEHAGLLNHLFAKIDDLQIDAGTVVAQTAPQCFDISLWQLFCALLVGGRTLLIEQAVVLDAKRFVDAIIDGRVNVLQVVPSYLDVILAYLQLQPRALPDLRHVAVTGEALKKELVQRWFAAQPGIKLVNAYGLTETCDDTNHEVMDAVPSRERVPLGRPINNVRVYVVDEQLAPVPLGAPGEILFSGVCVGRGYINDPERTQRAFLADPYRPGQRLYRSGDYGRWLPEGKLEYLGRRDTQVKISGFRIELGEIESALLRLPGVRDGAVVVTEQADHSQHLVAFYAGPQPLEAHALQDPLRESLPQYMQPSTFYWHSRLPLTDNGKVDRKALRALAGELDRVKQDHKRISTPTEHRLAQAWATVLGIPPEQIGREDHFVELGGTSLTALRLAIQLNRAVSLADLVEHPVLADLARLVDARSAQWPRAAEGLGLQQ